MSRKLSTIPTGQLVRITSIQDSEIKPKLMEMGLVNGKMISVLFKAPFGDPIAIDVQGYILSLRLDEARLIEVDDASEPDVFV